GIISEFKRRKKVNPAFDYQSSLEPSSQTRKHREEIRIEVTRRPGAQATLYSPVVVRIIYDILLLCLIVTH
ncbi:MAG: hypothetical protein ACRD5Z_07870, partial [Bryobacteraceae bacterium]